MRLLDHAYILATIIFTVYSQLVMRWQVSLAGKLPETWLGKIEFLFGLFLNPWILSGIFSTFLAGVSWMLAMTKFEISYAYPWVGLNFVLMLAFGHLLFDESMSIQRMLGTALIIVGIFVIAET